MTTPPASFAIQQSLIHKPFIDSRLEKTIHSLLGQKQTLSAAQVAWGIFKEIAYLGVTIAGRLPYYNMCFKLIPSLPALGATLGASYSVSWGSLVLQSCHSLERGVSVRSMLRDPEEKTSRCAEVAIITTSATLSMLGECAFFALAYLANDKSVPMLGCSIINAAIPTYSIYLLIHSLLRERRFGPLQVAQKADQALFLTKLDQIIQTLPSRDLTLLKHYFSQIQNKDLDSFERQSALKALLKTIHEEPLVKHTPTLTSTTSHIAQKISALFLTAVYLAWVGFLTYQGGEEISTSLSRLWITVAVIAVLANVYFMWKNMSGITKALPTAIYGACTGTSIPSLSHKYYPLASTVLNTVVIATSLLSFGPASVVSMQNLTHQGLALASSIALSTSMTAAPILPMMSGVDHVLSSFGKHFSTHAEDFAVYNNLRELRFILSSALEKDVGDMLAYIGVEELGD